MMRYGNLYGYPGIAAGHALGPDAAARRGWGGGETVSFEKKGKRVQSSVQSNLIYSDELVDVDDEGIRVKRYYFPSRRAKFIKFSSLLAVEKAQPNLKNGKYRYWRTGDFRTWFPLDSSRPRRDFIFFIRLKSQRTIVGLTVANTRAFIAALESKGVTITTT